MCLCVCVCRAKNNRKQNNERNNNNNKTCSSCNATPEMAAAKYKCKFKLFSQLSFRSFWCPLSLSLTLATTHCLQSGARVWCACTCVCRCMRVCAVQCCHVQNGHCCEMFFRFCVHCRHHWNKIATPALTLTAASVAVAAAAAATAGASRGTKNVGRISRPSTVLSLFLFPSSAHVGAAIGRATRPAAMCRSGGRWWWWWGVGQCFLFRLPYAYFNFCFSLPIFMWPHFPEMLTKYVCVRARVCVCVECACAFVKCEWYKGNVGKYEGSASETCESP